MRIIVFSSNPFLLDYLGLMLVFTFHCFCNKTYFNVKFGLLNCLYYMGIYIYGPSKDQRPSRTELLFSVTFELRLIEVSIF